METLMKLLMIIVIAVVLISVIGLGFLIFSGEDEISFNETNSGDINNNMDNRDNGDIENAGDINQDGLIDIEELSVHFREDDCWMMIEDKVYDITDFIKNYEGEISIDICGNDATDIFKKEFGENTEELLKEYYIGDFLGDY